MSEPTDQELSLPADLCGAELPPDEVYALLTKWGHPRPRRWIRRKSDKGKIRRRGEPPLLRISEVWGELLRDECDKLYNQAWCALDQIRNAEDEASVMMLAVDDFPSAVEQAFSLAPPFAGEHLELLREYRQERLDGFLEELAVGTEREAGERLECLSFWLLNAEGLSDLRRTLFELVCAELVRRTGRHEESGTASAENELAAELKQTWTRIREAFARGAPEDALPDLELRDGGELPSPEESGAIAKNLPELAHCRFLRLARRPDKPQLVGYYTEEETDDPDHATVVVISFVNLEGRWKFAPGPMGLERVEVDKVGREELLRMIDTDSRLRL